MVNAQQWLDANYPKEKRNKITELDIKNKELEGSLKLERFTKLESFGCSFNQITHLELNCPNLKKLYCSDNLLNNLDLSKNKKLEELEIRSNNFSEQDLSFLTHLVNLKRLDLENDNTKKIEKGIYNRFVGSLKSLENLTNLEELWISDTDIETGLEHLPNNLKSFQCPTKKRLDAKVRKIHEELFLYGGNLKSWKEAHPELVATKEKNKYLNTALVATVPVQLLKEKNKLEEDCNLELIVYSEIVLRDKRPFSWETNQIKSASGELPIRLYNVKSKQIESSQEKNDIKSYAALSYVWGDSEMKIAEEAKKVFSQWKDNLTILGNKALYKAIKTCEFLGIDYFWMDQLCIDQNNIEEKNQEVPKMRQYYNNSEVTLISINTDSKSSTTEEENRRKFIETVLKKIVNSQWFTRSWTYQEGLLSKQTIFMFDDCLVDGRILAQVWGLFNSNVDDYWYAGEYFYRKLNEEPQIIVTPLGWTYCNNKSEHKANLGLFQALAGIKNRKRGIPIDGIYSILGLLPYGNQVKPKYKKWGESYTKEELEEVLSDVMKVAFRSGSSSEILSWLGPRRSEIDKWWIPKIDDKGSTIIAGGIEITYKPKDAKFIKGGIILDGYKYIVDHLRSEGKIYSIDEDIGEIWVGTTDNNFFGFQGFKENLKKIKKGDILVIPDETKWKSNKEFAFLIPGKNNPCYQANVVDLISGHVKKEIKSKELIIDIMNRKVVEDGEEIIRYEAQHEIPPK